jgi:hypothetical protein
MMCICLVQEAVWARCPNEKKLGQKEHRFAFTTKNS